MADPIYFVRDALDAQGVELTTDIVETAVRAAKTAIFSPEELARVSASTGLSLQTVAEVARELKKS